MKRFGLSLLICSMSLFAFACDSDSDTSYDDSSKAACEYLVPIAGGNDFEFDFDVEEATADQIKKAKDLCVKELDGLPSCKSEFIKVNACRYAIESGKLSLKEYTDAVLACKDDKCEDEAKKLYPCYDEESDAERCWNNLWDNNETAANALEDYIDGYREKYADL